MEGDYLELSQFIYNSHPFPYNSHQSPLGTTGFLTRKVLFVETILWTYTYLFITMSNHKIKGLTKPIDVTSDQIDA